MIKTVQLLIVCLVIPFVTSAQSRQEKAQILVETYLANHYKVSAKQTIKFSVLESLNSDYAGTKTYKTYVYKIDSLKVEGRKIDARIPKLKTEAEIAQSKKDSKQLSNQLVATSDQMIDFMTTYKGTAMGWKIKLLNPKLTNNRKIFYLNKELTVVTQAK